MHRGLTTSIAHCATPGPLQSTRSGLTDAASPGEDIGSSEAPRHAQPRSTLTPQNCEPSTPSYPKAGHIWPAAGAAHGVATLCHARPSFARPSARHALARRPSGLGTATLGTRRLSAHGDFRHGDSRHSARRPSAQAQQFRARRPLLRRLSAQHPLARGAPRARHWSASSGSMQRPLATSALSSTQPHGHV